MSFVETLRLVLDADMKRGIGEVEKLGATAKREGGKAEDSLNRVGSTMTKVGAGMVAAGAAALFGLGKAAQASEDAHLQVVKLENSLRNMPKLAGENSKQFTDLADSIQDVTAADGDAIVGGEAMLATFNLTAQEIKGVTPLVVDYARKFGVDVVGAATQVGKALDGSVGALKRNGVSIDENLFKTDRYAAVTQALRDQVGGFAEDEGKTFAGSLERLKNQMGDVAEGVGVGAVDAFTDLFAVIQPGIEWFNDLDPAVQGTVGKIATFGSVALIAAGGASMLIGQAIQMRKNFSDAWGAISGLSDRTNGLSTAFSRAGIALGVLIAIGQAVDKFNPTSTANLGELEKALLGLGRAGEATGELTDTFGKDLDGLSDAVERLASPSVQTQMDHFEDEMFSLGGLLGESGLPLTEARQKINDLDDALTSLATRDPQAAREAFDALTDAAGLQGDEVIRLKDLLDGYRGALAGADTQSQLAAGSSGDFAERQEEQAAATEAAKTALQEYTDELRGIVDPFFAAQDAVFGLQEAQQRWTTAGVDAMLAQAAVTEAVTQFGEASPEAADAYAKLVEANQNLDQAQLTAERSTVDLQVAAEGLRSTVEQHPAALIQAKDEIYRLAIAAGFSHDQAMAMAASLDTATAAVDAHGRALDAIDGKTAKTEVLTTFTSRDSSGQAIRRFHEGGIVPGRRGQEMAAVLLAGEEVIPPDDPRHGGNVLTFPAGPGPRGAGGVGGAPTVRVVLDVTGADQDLVRMIRRMVKHDGGGNVQVAFGQ